MASPSYIARLFTYDHWANREIVDCLSRLERPPERSLNLLAHILSAERLWLERLQQQKQTHLVWPNFTLQQCKLEAEALSGLWTSYLLTLSEGSLSHSVSYKNTKGEIWNSSVEDILMHVVLHSAYHRGQIAVVMRASGVTPAYTDFIHAVRQEFVE
jgi:uncharacterized damage-inducible protein DinB